MRPCGALQSTCAGPLLVVSPSFAFGGLVFGDVWCGLAGLRGCFSDDAFGCAFAFALLLADAGFPAAFAAGLIFAGLPLDTVHCGNQHELTTGMVFQHEQTCQDSGTVSASWGQTIACRVHVVSKCLGSTVNVPYAIEKHWHLWQPWHPSAFEACAHIPEVA